MSLSTCLPALKIFVSPLITTINNFFTYCAVFYVSWLFSFFRGGVFSFSLIQFWCSAHFSQSMYSWKICNVDSTTVTSLRSHFTVIKEDEPFPFLCVNFLKTFRNIHRKFKKIFQQVYMIFSFKWCQLFICCWHIVMVGELQYISVEGKCKNSEVKEPGKSIGFMFGTPTYVVSFWMKGTIQHTV